MRESSFNTRPRQTAIRRDRALQTGTLRFQNCLLLLTTPGHKHIHSPSQCSAGRNGKRDKMHENKRLKCQELMHHHRKFHSSRERCSLDTEGVTVRNETYG